MAKENPTSERPKTHDDARSGELGRAARDERASRTVHSETSPALGHQGDPELASIVFDATNTVFIIVTPDGQIESINKAGLKLTGLTEEELIGRVYWEVVIPKEHRARHEAYFRSLQPSSLPETQESVWITKNGEKRTLSWTISAVLDAENRIQYLIGSGIDVTTQREAEIQIAAQTQLLDLASDAVFVRDLASHVTYFNPAAQRLYGLPDDLGSGFDEHALLKTEFPIPLPQIEADLLRAGSWTGEVVQYRADGARLFILSRWSLQRDPLGRPFRVLEINTDMTESRRQENALLLLSRAGQLLTKCLDRCEVFKAAGQLLLPQLADWYAIDTLEPDGSLVRIVVDHVDPQKQRLCERLKRIPLSRLSDSPMIRVSQSGEPELAENLSQASLKIAATKLADRESEEFHEVASRLGLTSYLIAPLITRGKTVGTLSLVYGDSGRSYQQRDLTFLQDLANRIATALDNADLFQKAQAASEAKSRFLANVSHEIRTPLGAVIGFADLALEKNDCGAETKSHIEAIRKNGAQLLELISDILDLSKVEAERLDVESLRFDLHELVRDLQSVLGVSAEAKGLALKFEFDPLPSHVVETDPTRIRQILMNLVGNAIKFTPSGSVAVRFSASRQEGQTMLRIAIEDTGIGLSPDQQHRLFQPFGQADSSTTRKFGGTGLGLLLSKKFAQRLGGDLILDESRPGQGTRFLVVLPVTWIESPHDADDSSTDSQAHATPTIKGARILLVEDSRDNQLIVGHYLRRAGASLVDVADNGRIGLEKALARTYDVVLMDIQMPVVDGYEAVRTLREKGYHAPVIALTAHAMKGEREKAIHAGFTNYLTKPVQKTALVEMVHRSIRTAKNSRF